MKRVQMAGNWVVRLTAGLTLGALLAGSLTTSGRYWVARGLGSPVSGTRLWAAVATGDVPQLRLAFAEGAQAEVRSPTAMTPLILAATGDQPEVLRELLAQGAMPNTAGPTGMTPLHVAAASGRLDNVRLLLEHGADVDCLSDAKTTPLMAAVVGGHEPVVALLLQRGAKLEPGPQRRVLVELASGWAAQPQLMERLIAAGADVNGPDANGLTPLQAAQQAGRADLAAVLLRHGARAEAAVTRPTWARK